MGVLDLWDVNRLESLGGRSGIYEAQEAGFLRVVTSFDSEASLKHKQERLGPSKLHVSEALKGNRVPRERGPWRRAADQSHNRHEPFRRQQLESYR